MPITAIATIAQVRQYLRFTNPTNASQDDATLTIMMNAATEVVEAEIGHIIPARFSERHNGGVPEIWLREKPVLEISQVEEGWGYFNEELDDQLVNSQPALSIWAYSLDMPDEGLVTRRGPGNVQVPFVNGRDNIKVDYLAGREVMPGNAQLVFLELVAHWYRTSQQRASGAANIGGYQPNAVINQDFTRSTGITSVNFGVPMELLAMLRGDRGTPVMG